MKPSKTIENIRQYLANFNREKDTKSSKNNQIETKKNKLNQIHDELYSVSPRSIGQLLSPTFSREQVELWMDGQEEIPDDYLQQTIELRTLIQVKVLDAIDTILHEDHPRTYLVYHINDWTLEDYEPEQYQLYGNAEFHLSFILKLRTALKSINKDFYVTRFDYKNYDSWLNATGRKNSPDNLKLWASKRCDDGINYFGETPEEEEDQKRKMIAPFLENIEKARIARGEIPEA